MMTTTCIAGGIVYQNPMSKLGGPYVNQWVPVRRATVPERLAWWLGKAPARSPETDERNDQ